jgi:hypothetical protein
MAAATLNVFDVIERLSQSLPLEPARVAEIMNTRLDPDPEGDTPISTSFVQPDSVKNSDYESVEVRIPDPVFGTDGGLVQAVLKNDAGIDSDAIFQQYGLEFQQDVPTPRSPAGLPAYYTYEFPWGALSLGVTNDDADKLVSFILKPNEPTPSEEEEE